MSHITRRFFTRQSALAAAVYGCWPRGLDAQRPKGAAFDAESIRKLSGQVAGRVITPETSEYDAARSILSQAFDRHPAAIVRCASATDVARTLEFAVTRRLPLAVRGGGHSRLGFGMCDGGVVIDLSPMKRIEVDAGKRGGPRRSRCSGARARHGDAAFRASHNFWRLPDRRDCGLDARKAA